MEFAEILSRKLNPRDQAKVILEYAKSELLRDRDHNCRLYHKIESIGSNIGIGDGTILPDDEFSDLVSALYSKLEFTSNVLLGRILATCNEMLLTACSEQGELMSFALQEIKNALDVISSTIKSIHSVVLAILNEKNIFASKALCLAKAVRSVYFHDLELTSLHPTVSYYTILSDICLRNFVSIPRVLEMMFIKLGGTANCNRYTCKEEGRSLGSTLENLENDKKLITSVNDMIEYLETSYTSKITNYFIADVRETVMSLLREMNEKNDMENRNKKVVGKFAKSAVGPINHPTRSRHMILSTENESELLVQKLVFQRRNAAAFNIQCCYYRYKRRLRIRQRIRLTAANMIVTFFKISRFKTILFRRVLQSFIRKRAARIIRRVECFLEMCTPITIAQHALKHSKTFTSESQNQVERDIFHERLLNMAKWDWYQARKLEEITDVHQHFFSRISIPPEALEGFGTKEYIEGSIACLEERCSVYSIIGSSVLRYGSLPVTVDLTKDNTNLKKKSENRVRALTINDKRPRPDSSSFGRRSRFSQKSTLRAVAPDEIKPSQLPYRRTMITSSEIPRSTLKPSLSPSPLTIEDKSLSSLGLSESEKDDEPKKLAMIPSRPSSKSKTRSTIIKEAPGRTPNLNCGDFCPSPPISENVSHEQRLSTLLEKFRSLDGVS